jgi:hypothetical protein
MKKTFAQLKVCENHQTAEALPPSIHDNENEGDAFRHHCKHELFHLESAEDSATS